MHTIGVDFDKRCKKYRVRLTRDGVVYLIAYSSSFKKASKIRKDALEKFNKNQPFDFLHSYETASRKKRAQSDDYLYKLGLSNEDSSPHRSLLVAILMQAIKDRLSDDKEVKAEVKHWFESKERDTLQFSFLDICDELCIKPYKVKQIIQNSEKEKKPSRRVVGRRLVRSSKNS